MTTSRIDQESGAGFQRACASDVSEAQARWKPAPDSWSILEVVSHLYDEEREDFRVRLDYILHHPDQPLPKIDPEGWVTERGYSQRELGPTLDNFMQERQSSLAWLRGLSEINWQALYQTPYGQISAGDMFASWVAHDLLHLRQLVELHWAYTVDQLQPYNVDYAGRW